MTDKEIELIGIVSGHKHPEQALITAIETILNYLGQPQSSEEPSVVVLPAPS